MANRKRLFASFLTMLLVMLLFFITAIFEYKREIEAEKRSVSDQLSVIAADLSGTLNSYIFYGNGVRAFIHENPIFSETEMTGLISNLISEKDPLLRNFTIIKDTTIVFAFPKEPNHAAIGIDLSKIEGQKETVLMVKNTGKTFITGPVKLVQGGNGIILRMAVYTEAKGEKEYWGQVSSVLSYENFGNRINIESYKKDNYIRIYEKNEADTKVHVLWSNVESPFSFANGIKKELKLSQSTWVIEAIPKEGWKGTTLLFELILVLGVLASFVTGQYIYITIGKREALAEKVREKTQELQASYNELKEAQNQLIENEKLASLGVLVAGIAHEINTPLGISVSTASYMDHINRENRSRLQDGKMTKTDLMDFMEGMDESLQILNTNVTRAADLIKSFKQIAADQNHEISTEFYLAEYFESIIKSLGHEFRQRKISVEIYCDETLKLYSFPGAFTQIITNLALNSVVHGFKGRTGGRIGIQVEQERDRLEIFYTDDGNGISEEHLKKIFDPFFTTNREHGGTGLGLNVIYNIVVGKLKGAIKCESTEGEGVLFKITIPVERMDGKWKTKG